MLALFEFFYGNIDINGLILKGFMIAMGIAGVFTKTILPKEGAMFELQSMKKIFIAAMVSLLVSGSISIANAWELTVRNDTGKNCKVLIYDDRFAANYPREEVTIASGSSYTWHTGGYCPDCMKGEIYASGQSNPGWRKIKWTNCLGKEIAIADGCTACCWNTSWRICRKRGEGYDIRDDDYGFCKE